MRGGILLRWKIYLASVACGLITNRAAGEWLLLFNHIGRLNADYKQPWISSRDCELGGRHWGVLL